MITPDELRQKKEYPSAKVVCCKHYRGGQSRIGYLLYLGNAVRVVQKLGDAPEIIFVPDQYRVGGWPSRRGDP
jgi:quinolinate synthase